MEDPASSSMPASNGMPSPSSTDGHLQDTLRHSTVARLLVEGRLPEEEGNSWEQADGMKEGGEEEEEGRNQGDEVVGMENPNEEEETPMDLSAGSGDKESHGTPPPPQVSIENVDPDMEGLPQDSSDVSPDLSGGIAEVQGSVSSTKSGRKRRRKQTTEPTGEGDLFCPYCPFQADNKRTMSSHYQFHQQILGSQSMSSRRSHLEWIQAFQASQLPRDTTAFPIPASATSSQPGPSDSPTSATSSGQSGSPTLRSLLVGGSSGGSTQGGTPDGHSASGFLRSIVQTMMGGQPADKAVASSTTNTPIYGSGASPLTLETPPRPAPAPVSSMLASVLYGTGSNTIPTAEPVRVKIEPQDDYASESISVPSMVPTSTTGSFPTTETIIPLIPAMVRIKEEPQDESSPDPHDPEWNPDSHSSGSSPLSGVSPEPISAPPVARNSRKGNPKKRILGNFLQRREEELQLPVRTAVNQPSGRASGPNPPQLMLSLLKEPVRPSNMGATTTPTTTTASTRGRRGGRTTRSAVSSRKPQSQPQTLPTSEFDPNQGVRIYINKNDDKKYVDKYVQCQLLVDDMTDTDLKKAFGDDYGYKASTAKAGSGGLEKQGVVVGEAQEGQMGSYLHSIRCPHCCITFEDEVMYSIHMGCHSHKDPFICNVCGKHCSHKYEFYTHIVRGHQADDS